MMPIPQITVKALNITCLHRLAHAIFGTCLGPGPVGVFSQACAPWGLSAHPSITTVDRPLRRGESLKGRYGEARPSPPLPFLANRLAASSAISGGTVWPP